MANRNRRARAVSKNNPDVADSDSGITASKPGTDINELLHELQVHQVELEAQNQNLTESQRDLEELRDQYYDLFEFAPVALFTLDKSNNIKEVNQAACDLLDEKKSALINKRFTRFISSGAEKLFINLKKTVDLRTTTGCDLEMVNSVGARLTVRIQIKALKNEANKIRIALFDFSQAEN